MVYHFPPNTKPPLPAPNLAPLAILATLFTLLGTLFACARLFVRGTILRALKWDDHWLLLSMVSGIAGYAVVTVFTFRDFPHMRTDPAGQNNHRLPTGGYVYQGYNKYYQDFGNLNVAAMALNVFQNSCSRLSLLFSYRRFTPSKAGFAYRRIVINTFAVLAAVHGAEFTFLEIFPCYPIHVMSYPNYKWQSSKYTCLPPRAPFFVGGIIGAVIDAGVYGLPFWLLWKAELKQTERTGLYGLFAFGGAVFVFSIVRIPLVYAPLNGPPLFTVPTQQMITMWIVTVIEAQCILIAASIPTLRPLLRAGGRALERFRKFRREGGMRKLVMRSVRDSTQPPSYASRTSRLPSRDDGSVPPLGTLVSRFESGYLPVITVSDAATATEKSRSNESLESSVRIPIRPPRIGDDSPTYNEPSGLGVSPLSVTGSMLTRRSGDIDILLDPEGQWDLPFEAPPPLPSKDARWTRNDNMV